MAAEEHAQTPGEYIIHHLTHFGTGKPKGLVDFSIINFDSVVFSALIMWMPVCGPLPELRYSLGAQMPYLFLQSIIPTVPAGSVTWRDIVVLRLSAAPE